MPRKKRIVIPELPHHVTQRGGRRQDVFFTVEDREVYLRLLQQGATKHKVQILSYCLMTNHVHHLLVPSDKVGLSRTMQITHKKYAEYINRKHRWGGHLWQERFYSSPLEKSAALVVLKYIERNPVEANIVPHPYDYRWSSANAHCGIENTQLLANKPHWWRELLKEITDWYSWLDTPNKTSEIKVLRTCTRQDLPFGSDNFISNLEQQLDMPLRQRRQGRPPKK